jgi:hypothetical protein
MTINAPSAIKDEAYLQVLKQITENPDPEKTIRGWNFLAILASTFSPSKTLFYSLLNHFLNEIKNNKDPEFVKRSNYIFTRLVKINERRRKNVPSNEEIQCIENMKSMVMPVYFYSENMIPVPYESYTTIRDFKTTVLRKIKVNPNKYNNYCLHEIKTKRDNQEERFMNDNAYLSDDVSNWEKSQVDAQKEFESVSFKVYLRLFVYYPYNKSDADTLSLLYLQVKI